MFSSQRSFNQTGKPSRNRRAAILPRRRRRHERPGSAPSQTPRAVEVNALTAHPTGGGGLRDAPPDAVCSRKHSMDDKDTIRGLASAARQKQPDALATSRIITDRLMNLGVYQRAECVLWYVGVRHEVATRQALPAAVAEGTRTVVPCCLGARLELFRLTKMDQLTRGAYGIPEPVSALRENPEFRLDAAELDLVVVPGVAFDVH